MAYQPILPRSDGDTRQPGRRHSRHASANAARMAVGDVFDLLQRPTWSTARAFLFADGIANDVGSLCSPFPYSHGIIGSYSDTVEHFAPVSTNTVTRVLYMPCFSETRPEVSLSLGFYVAIWTCERPLFGPRTAVTCGRYAMDSISGSLIQYGHMDDKGMGFALLRLTRLRGTVAVYHTMASCDRTLLAHALETSNREMLNASVGLGFLAEMRRNCTKCGIPWNQGCYCTAVDITRPQHPLDFSAHSRMFTTLAGSYTGRSLSTCNTELGTAAFGRFRQWWCTSSHAGHDDGMELFSPLLHARLSTDLVFSASESTRATLRQAGLTLMANSSGTLRVRDLTLSRKDETEGERSTSSSQEVTLRLLCTTPSTHDRLRSEACYGVDGASTKPGCTREQVRMARRERNRAAAERSNARKRRHETNVKAELQHLKSRIPSLERVEARLRAEQNELRRRLVQSSDARHGLQKRGTGE